MMNIKKSRIVPSLLVLLLMFTAITPGCKSGNGVVATSAPSAPIKVTIRVEEPPVLGEPVNLMVDYSFLSAPYPKYAAEKPPVEMKYKIEIPEDIVISGETRRTDFLAGEATQRLSLTLRIDTKGVWKIRASAIAANANEPGGYSGLSGAAYAWIVSDETGITIRDNPPSREGPINIPHVPSTDNRSFKHHPLPDDWQTPKTPDPLPPPPSSLNRTESSSSGAINFSNPLTVTGGFSCNISEDKLPSPGDERKDVMEAMVWGGVYIYKYPGGELWGSNITGTGAHGRAPNLSRRSHQMKNSIARKRKQVPA
ncbi:hypothetical protein ACFLWS_01180 [Chloroflexota bacterium]